MGNNFYPGEEFKIDPASLGVSDADGTSQLGNGTWAWYRHDASSVDASNDVYAIGGASFTNYFVSDEDVGYYVSLKFQFTDDAGNDEFIYLTSDSPIVEAPNSPANFNIYLDSGEYSVGETVLINFSVSDADGHEAVSQGNYSITWYRHDSQVLNLGDANSYEIINVSDAHSYTVSHDDQLHYISTQVSFVDGKGNLESAVFTSSNIVPTSELTQTSLMALEDYPSDPELLSLFAVDGSQYKWGGDVGTPTALTYSFASMDSFIDGEVYTFGSDYYDAFDGDADFVCGHHAAKV